MVKRTSGKVPAYSGLFINDEFLNLTMVNSKFLNGLLKELVWGSTTLFRSAANDAY